MNIFLAVAGGRFKKEVIIDGQSYLLLIRDEGGAPEMQVLLFQIRVHQKTLLRSIGFATYTTEL